MIVILRFIPVLLAKYDFSNQLPMNMFIWHELQNYNMKMYLWYFDCSITCHKNIDILFILNYSIFSAAILFGNAISKNVANSLFFGGKENWKFIWWPYLISSVSLIYINKQSFWQFNQRWCIKHINSKIL